MPPIPSRRRLSFSLLAVALIVLSIHPLSASSDEFSVISHPAKLQLPLGQHVDSSPGSRPGSITTCNRVRVVGLSRLRDPAKYAHALKIRVSVPQGDGLFRVQAIEECNSGYWDVSGFPMAEAHKRFLGSAHVTIWAHDFRHSDATQPVKIHRIIDGI